MISLGDRVQDLVNGFSGIVSGITVYLYTKTRQCMVESREKDSNGQPVARWIEEGRLSKEEE